MTMFTVIQKSLRRADFRARIPWFRFPGLLQGAGFMVLSLMAANFLNFLFNAYLGRELSFEDYGLVTFITSLLYLVSVIISAVSTTVNHRVAFLNGHSGTAAGNRFYSFIHRRVLFLSAIASVVWIISTPILMKFFNVADPFPIIAFVPLFLFAILLAVSKGYMQGNLFFMSFGIATLLEALAKLLLAIGFVQFHVQSFVYLTVPISILLALVITRILITSKKIKPENSQSEPFPRRFFGATIISGLATTAFLTIDVLLVKHYLNPAIAGEYSLLSLVGKMIFFFGSLFSGFIITMVSRQEGLHQNGSLTFYKLLGLTCVAVTIMFLAVGPFGYLTLPILFGSKAQVILPYLTPYCGAIALFTIANAFLVFHLAKHHYSFPVASLILSAALTILIIFNHSSIGQIVNVILLSSTLNFVVMVFLHLIYRKQKFIIANLLDLLDLFSKSTFQKGSASQKRILIYNWRDTKHIFGGGAEVYIQELAKRWVRDGNQVTIFCGNDGKNSRYEIIDGIEIIRRGGFYFVYIWAFFYYLLKFRGKYDFIIDCENGIPFFTPLYVKEPVYCVIHHVHQEVFKTYTKKMTLEYLMAKFAAILENRVMPWAYKEVQFITVSDSSKQEMEELGLTGKGIQIIHNGVNLEQLYPGAKSKNPTILYLGRLKNIKSIDVLIKSFNLVVRRVPKAKLIIAGSGEDEDSLKKLVTDLGLTDYVEFFGKVSENQKLNLYQKAWIFVNPSMMEGWGITTIEANACGTPVIASDVPGLRDSVRNPHTGFLVPYGDEKRLAQKIIYLCDHNFTRQKFSRQALSWAKGFDWNMSAYKSLQLMS